MVGSCVELAEDDWEIFEGGSYNLVLTKVAAISKEENTGYDPASPKRTVCSHIDTVSQEGSKVCNDCGMVIEELSYEKDWRYYGSSDSRAAKDPSRCNKGKGQQRNIYKDVENMNFPEAIIKIANRDYHEIVKDNIYRADKRKSIIAACIFYSYFSEGEIYTSEHIGQKFKLDRKCLSEGLKRYQEKFPAARKVHITPKDLTRFLLNEAKIPLEENLTNIKNICSYTENRSSLLNRSSPQSVCAGIIYLYLCLKPALKESLGLTKIKFSKLVGLSDITVGKIAKDVARLIFTDVKI